MNVSAQIQIHICFNVSYIIVFGMPSHDTHEKMLRKGNKPGYNATYTYIC